MIVRIYIYLDYPESVVISCKKAKKYIYLAFITFLYVTYVHCTLWPYKCTQYCEVTGYIAG